MLPEDKNQTEEELSVVICITRDLKEGTWDWMKSVKFPARYAGSLFSCVRNQKQSACKYMYFFCISCLVFVHDADVNHLSLIWFE